MIDRWREMEESLESIGRFGGGGSGPYRRSLRGLKGRLLEMFQLGGVRLRGVGQSIVREGGRSVPSRHLSTLLAAI